MEKALFVVAIVGISVFVVSFVALVLGILRQMRKIGEATESLSSAVKALERELTLTAHDARMALHNIDRLAEQATETVEHVDSVALRIDRIIGGTSTAVAATKAVKSSTAALVSVYEAFKRGIKSLRGS